MKAFDFLNTSRTRIRRFQPKDRDKLIELLCDKAVTQHMTFPEELLTERGISDLLEVTIDSYESEKPLLSYAITLKKDDCLIGITGYRPLSNNEVEVSYALLPSYWGRGFASEILVRISNYALTNGNYDVVIAPITRANKPSIRVAEKAGFSNYGVQEHPEYDDLVVMLKKEKATNNEEYILKTNRDISIERSLRIRQIHRNETHFLTEMLYEAIFIPEGHNPLPRDIIKDPSLTKYIKHWGKDKYDIALVVEADNQLVGVIWGRLLTNENKGFGYVDDQTPELSMAVKHQYRNQGIGTELIKAIILEYQKLGVSHLSLSVDKANKASNLYKRLGFEMVKETKTSWTMKKRIK